MDWHTLFSVFNTYVLLPWAALLFAPRGPKVHALIFYLGIGLLVLAYSIGIVTVVVAGPGLDPRAFGSLEGVMGLMASEAGATIGWVHYLAFDLFVGQWIAKDGDHKGVARIAQAPILVLTLLAGPLGLFVWMVVRERAAQAVSSRTGR